MIHSYAVYNYTFNYNVVIVMVCNDAVYFSNSLLDTCFIIRYAG